MGLTPAQAGTAHSEFSGQPFPGAHPRAGGDGLKSGLAALMQRGSPPRRRGRRAGSQRRRPPAGLTPAQAGTAPEPRLPSAGNRAHPRAGGDGPNALMFEWASPGSPPRRRGRHFLTSRFAKSQSELSSLFSRAGVGWQHSSLDAWTAAARWPQDVASA